MEVITSNDVMTSNELMNVMIMAVSHRLVVLVLPEQNCMNAHAH